MPITPETAALVDRLAGGGIRLGADTTRRLLRALGEPQFRVPAVLITGTNGKGSTAALLASMATAAGYRTGLFTSPPLEDFAEQVRVDGQAASATALAAAFRQVMLAAERALPEAPTLFEALTAAAVLHFAASGCSLMVLEAGMGGFRDATNAVDASLAIVTGVGFDHQEHLGSTLADIAAEKAGIFRPDRPALVGALDPQALLAIRLVAVQVRALLWVAPDETSRIRAVPRGWAGQRVTFSSKVRLPRRMPGGRWTPETPEPKPRRYGFDLPLLGAHQAGNLSLAVLATEILVRDGWTGFTRRAITEGAARCRWPGRLERVDLGATDVLLDAAHNPQGVAALLAFLATMQQPFDLLFGVLEDKEVKKMLRPLALRARRVVLTNPGGPRGRNPQEILPYALGAPAVVHPDPAAALDAALRPAPGLLVVCGSLRLVGVVRSRLRERFGVPAAALDL